MDEGRRIEVEGAVQGVGFRPWVHRTACDLRIRGCVVNTPRGVTIEAYAERPDLDALVIALRDRAPAAARVRHVRTLRIPPAPVPAFTIEKSEEGGEHLLSVAPDLAPCPACLGEISDPLDRHYGYAFTSCTECGPRYSIVDAMPYDRARTSLSGFALCPACEKEYADPSDRRFHAQAIACPACGPSLWLADAFGAHIQARDPIGAAAERLDSGEILAVQGSSGFHLACDATRADIVAALRLRKRRDQKPFAVMVKDLEMAERFAVLDDASRVALTSPARPIVLVTPRVSSSSVALAWNVGGPSSRVGLYLPPSPLHHLLLAKAKRPLVMTSGNLSGEPIAITHADAVHSLGAIADAFLLHDRPIARRVEDSVVAESVGTVRVLRRARGYAPDAIRLRAAASEPVLAVGGHLKNTACLVVGDRAYLTPHLGDLENFTAEEAFRDDVAKLERLLGVHAEIVAHDLHPSYASTLYALARPARLHVGVQHHVAHALATIAELRLDEPVVAVVFDGTGWGPDGTSWGAEILHVDGARWSRPYTFRALPLAGGERAIREVWRTAYGALRDASGEETGAIAARLAVFAEIKGSTLATLDRMIGASIQTVRARGMGRWFDAIGALVLGLPRASFEGHVAMVWEEAAAVSLSDRTPAYPYGLPRTCASSVMATADHEVDLRPTVRSAVLDHLAGIPAGAIAARFHRTIVEATAAVVLSALKISGAQRVVLSGGSFQNRILASGIASALGDRVAMACDVPVNDGGLALGQAWAGCLASRGEALRYEPCA